jgi:hypothetical protein
LQRPDTTFSFETNAIPRGARMKYTRVRELIPPMYPPDSFTYEQAAAALAKAEAEDEAQQKARRERAPGPKRSTQDGVEAARGEDP